ncbi:unnamed protein product [Hymenolepis diminuta]|uniref:Calcium-binding protein n=1 Tax=Hymenolepis diminuta TaxID=6216 RepID=A0A0R3SL08_HYMDI|nr:unnamed protein product [Hymenolepis diminuta]VUZ44714.1 unnamed protein product [Hymenolepis diminuta]
MCDFKSEVEKLFHELDKDKSGKISAAELKAALQACSKVPLEDEHVKLFLQKVDTNGDGELSLDELMELLKD